MLSLAYSALRRGGIIPCVLNAANERAVELFLAGKISLITDIFGAVIEAVEKSVNVKTPSIDDIKACLLYTSKDFNMAEITAKMVAELRAKTGCGMMDCKKA